MVDMRYIIYKITNKINGKYYIGRHATKNIEDSYMGSGIGISNAIKKYGIENFYKEIIAESFSPELLWELEKDIVNDEVINDPLSYNMAYGGKNYIDGLKKYNPEKFKEHQSLAGKSGGKSLLNSLSLEDKKQWHSKGGKTAAIKNKNDKTHPFYNGTACVKGGQALIGYIELWNPNSKATNKNQISYKKGDCKRVKKNSELYTKLLSEGWCTIETHKLLRNK